MHLGILWYKHTHAVVQESDVHEMKYKERDRTE